MTCCPSWGKIIGDQLGGIDKEIAALRSEIAQLRASATIETAARRSERKQETE